MATRASEGGRTGVDRLADLAAKGLPKVRLQLRHVGDGQGLVQPELDALVVDELHGACALAGGQERVLDGVRTGEADSALLGGISTGRWLGTEGRRHRSAGRWGRTRTNVRTTVRKGAYAVVFVFGGLDSVVFDLEHDPAQLDDVSTLQLISLASPQPAYTVAIVLCGVTNGVPQLVVGFFVV